MANSLHKSRLSIDSVDNIVIYDQPDLYYGPQTDLNSPTFHTPSPTSRRSRARSIHHRNSLPLIAPQPEPDEESPEPLELEMDTFNKGSQGRGGWKMLGSGPEGSMRFEAFSQVEIAAMIGSLIAVFSVTGVAMVFVFDSQLRL